MREDVFEFSLNLQQIVIKSTVFPFLGTAKLQKKGPAIVTAADIILPDGLFLINPYQYLCTLNEGYTLNLALVLSSPARTRFESGIPLKMTVSLNSLSSATNPNEGFPSQDLRRSVGRRKRKDSNEGEKTLKNSPKLLTKDSPKSLPLDSVLVDPIYAPIQSCSFEILNVVGSYFPEYMELTKSGLNQTPEYLRMSVVTNGSIEPVLAIQEAIQELYGSLSLFLPLTHIFSSYYNKIFAFELNQLETITVNQAKKFYFDEILKKVDLINLNLSEKIELILRRNGISTIGNLISMPLMLLKRSGITKQDFLSLKFVMNKFGFWDNVSAKDWDDNLN